MRIVEKFKRKRNKILYKKGIIKLPVIKKYKSQNQVIRLSHTAAFLLSNAGDAILPVNLKDLFHNRYGKIKWNNIHVHNIVDQKAIIKINQSKGLLIGGGGLFLKDTNQNLLSGWQWKCSVKALDQIQVPIAVFAVGYNRFRGQDDFEPVFKEHIQLLTKKSVYIGLRNQGSIEAYKKYIPETLHHKVRFQPCMTTLISKLYPSLFNIDQKKDFIALNCAFDRRQLRFGERENEVLINISKACKTLSEKYPIRYYTHTRGDRKMLPYLDKARVDYKLIDLNEKHPKRIIKEYSSAKLVIGMRGHAQMIPFGCNTPILSLISHDKLQWFLNDINHPEWGVDIKSKDVESQIINKSLEILKNYKTVLQQLHTEQDHLWEISQKNIGDFLLHTRD